MKHFSRDSALRQREWEKLLTLTNNAAVAVLEFAVEWQLGQDNIARIVDDTRLEVVMQADLDLRRSPGMDGDHHQRRIMVLAAAADTLGRG